MTLKYVLLCLLKIEKRKQVEVSAPDSLFTQWIVKGLAPSTFLHRDHHWNVRGLDSPSTVVQIKKYEVSQW